jgi:hypothetical protein
LDVAFANFVISPIVLLLPITILQYKFYLFYCKIIYLYIYILEDIYIIGKIIGKIIAKGSSERPLDRK